jgi:hypothetical protein
VQTFYNLLSLDPSASADEIKKAFRAEIARYHPDKVQHLGKEFQEMAATRAAQLTEAYRTLMNPELRQEYDRSYGGGKPAPAAASSPPVAGPSQPAEPSSSQAGDPAVNPAPRFAKEHATRDEVVKKATLGRVRQVVAREHGQVPELTIKGFDFHCSIKSKKLFGRGDEQRLAVRVVPVVNGAAIQETWALAQKAGGKMCVLLMGSGMSAAGELAEAINDMRRKSRGDAGISVIPIDLRDWSAHIPESAPPICKNILLRLRESKM